MSGADPRPFLVVTALLDAGARPAAVTRSHADAMERAVRAAEGEAIAGIELAEIPVASAAFAAMRRAMTLPATVVALYEVFALPATVTPEVRRAAGQFLAAERLWALEDAEAFGGIAPGDRIELPRGWGRTPQEVRDRLVEAGALEIGEAAAATYRAIKARWDASQRLVR
ncbi:MAG: hypothetical protein NZ898_15485 [Myxococcota bacterium]|nr:hypothetical protein [Myxococcota bacterium]MDW8364013.1 hypothetical protein [Myxococcales bacterium]